MSGQGALMMVMGEPGIGKTALCEQLATYVTLRGGRTLVGHCYEEGSLSLPYLAFVEAMRSYVLNREDKDLQKDLGTSGGDVARIVSEIRGRLKIKLRPQKDPEEDRYRLLQGVTSFLSNAANVRPLVVVLEDLHDADKGTLEMLTHLSRNLAGTRLLIVGTYRDVEVDRNHPLSATLADLRRVATYGRVQLRGLNADEVRRMLESITRESVPWGLAEAVHKQTEGNPLFVQEVIRFLAEEGLITQKEGRWRTAKGTPLEMSIPEGLRDVIGRRLSLLSKECNQLLSVAAVIGREFRLDVLQKVAGLSDEELFATLEQAKRAAVIEERSGVGAAVTYRFAHAFFRQTLYEETIAPRRIRLHLQVAKALEGIYANRLEEHAAELAEHFSYSSDSADLKKAVSYGEMAAGRAMGVYAYSEAVRLLEHAIKVQNVLDPEDKGKACDLLLALCDVLLGVPDTKRVLDTEAPLAFSVAEGISDSPRAVRACMAALAAISNEQATPGFTTPLYRKWAERADRYAKPDTMERARADWILGSIKCEGGDIRSGLKLLSQAFDLARRLGDHFVMGWVEVALLMYRSAPQHTAERLRLAEEIEARLRTGLNARAAPVGIFLGDTFMAVGQRQRAEQVWGDTRKRFQHDESFYPWLMSATIDSVLTLMDGRLEDALEISERMRTRGKESGVSGFSNIWASSAQFRASLYLGPAYISRLPKEMGILLVLVHAHQGKKEEVANILDAFVVRRPGIGTLEDETVAWADILLLEASVISGHLRSAELLLNRLSGTGLLTSGFQCPTCLVRHLGKAAALLGRSDEARTHYQEAVNICKQIRFRPELALTRLQLAELLLERYPDEKAEAIEHLDFAIKEFREMNMQPSLEQALRHKNILKA